MKEQKHSIVVEAVSNFVASESAPAENLYVFAYTITIHNQGDVSARLLTRHWLVSDTNGKVEEIHGNGVVGLQPLLRPGETFRYSSAATITSPIAIMKGSYGMVAEDGKVFLARIPPLTLAIPRTLH